jgi:hypothetical protein
MKYIPILNHFLLKIKFNQNYKISLSDLFNWIENSAAGEYIQRINI